MKKILCLLLIITFFITSKAYAESFNVIIDNKVKKVNEVNVEVDSKVLETKYKAYTATGRTFVPIRELTESLGAKVDWDNKTKSATISLNNKVIKLKINSNVVYIDGKKTLIEKNSVPKFALYINQNKGTKTMVPLRFLSETFGYEVNWDAKGYIAGVNTEKKDVVNADNKDLNKDVNKDTDNVKKDEVNTDNKDVKSQSTKDGSNEKAYSFDFSSEVNNNTATKNSNGDNAGDSKVIRRNISKKIKLDGPLTIVIDPGHGGKDSGALGYENRTKEKNFTLEIGKKLYNKLKENNMNVYLTRDDDYFVTLDGRADFANKVNANLYLSIHMNASDNTSADGIEVFYAPALRTPIKETEQIYFAKELQKSLIKATGATNRGVKDGGRLVVLRKTKGVAALAELGFITNEREVSKLQDEDYQDKLVNALYDGIKNYIDNYVE